MVTSDSSRQCSKSTDGEVVEMADVNPYSSGINPAPFHAERIGTSRSTLIAMLIACIGNESAIYWGNSPFWGWSQLPFLPLSIVFWTMAAVCAGFLLFLTKLFGVKMPSESFSWAAVFFPALLVFIIFKCRLVGLGAGEISNVAVALPAFQSTLLLILAMRFGCFLSRLPTMACCSLASFLGLYHLYLHSSVT